MRSQHEGSRVGRKYWDKGGSVGREEEGNLRERSRGVQGSRQGSVGRVEGERSEGPERGKLEKGRKRWETEAARRAVSGGRVRKGKGGRGGQNSAVDQRGRAGM